MKPKRGMSAAATIVTLAVALLGLATPGLAQEDPAQVDPELREAMTKFFHQRVRAELALSDDQAEAVIPLFTSLEQTRQLNDKLDTALLFDGANQALSLLGRTVEVVTDGGTVVGVVNSTAFLEGSPVLNIQTSTGQFLTDITLSQIRIVR